MTEVFFLGLFVCALVFVFRSYTRLRRSWRLADAMSAVTLYEGINDDPLAVETFLKLLDNAEHSIEVFNDGNKMAGSIYEDDDVIDLLRRKLEGNPNFTALFFLNSCDRTKLRTELEGNYEGLTILSNPSEERPQLQTHYKIVDGGAFVYLTRHEYDSPKRSTEFYDGRDVSSDLLGQVTRIRFGAMMDNVRTMFDQPAKEAT